MMRESLFVILAGLIAEPGLAAQASSYTDPLPTGSVAIPDKTGHFVECKPPKGYKSDNFKELCKQFLKENRLVRIAMPDPKFPMSTWFTRSDFPYSSQVRGVRDNLTIRVEVSPTGAVANCVVEGTSGASELDEAACKAVRAKARFLPRIGRDGNAETGFWIFPVTWRDAP